MASNGSISTLEMLLTSSLIVLQCILGTMTAAANTQEVKGHVLVFGGNGFIGSELVNSLIQSGGWNITIVSRGNWYFDAETRIKPFVNHVVCDRENSDLEYCEDLMRVVKENSFKFVFDFSAYRSEVLEAALEILNNKTELYVYISSDSVYEVCENRREANNGLSREEDAVRPDSEEERDRLNDLDDYGHEKFVGEEVLLSNRASGGCPYLVVRLPDVIGPRDTTERIWTYIMWIQFFDYIKVPIFIPTHLQQLRTSYVYVKDVVRALWHLIDLGVKDNVFNVGFEETFTLQEFLQALAKEVGPTVEYTFTAPESFSLFPSVTRGGVNISKLKNMGFVPTTFSDALRETVAFYKDAFFTQESERDDVVHQLTKYVMRRERKGDFLKFIDSIAAAKGDVNAQPETRSDL